MNTVWDAAAIGLVVLCCGFALHRWAVTNWFLVRLWRWFSGEAHHGRPITNAGWTRRGYGPALTPTKHAHAWWYRPRWQRAAHRTGGTFGGFGLILGWLAAPLLTLFVLLTATVAGCGWAGWKLRQVFAARAERRTWLHPLHLAAHELAGWPRAVPARSWITTELDDDGAVRKATLQLTEGWPADARDKDRLVSIASQKLGIEAPEPSWRLAGPTPLLTLTHSPPPPGLVSMDELIPELLKCKPGDLLVGVGKNGSLVTASLDTDSPHIAVSMGTGGGKSNLGSWLLLQMLLRGSIGLVLDAKRRLSYPWILKDEHGAYVPLPVVAYAWTTAQMHECMCWMSGELDRRGDVAFAAMDARGKISANVGPRLLTLAEELNLAVPRLRSYWSELRDEHGGPTKSPAFTGLGEVAFAGRAVRKHLALIGQMLTAEATGSRDSSVKENCGIKFMARYGPKGWRIMAEDVPMPPPPSVTGRVQVVTAGVAREAQVPLFDGVQARELVLASDMALLPDGMPCRPAARARVAAASVAAPVSDQRMQPVSVAAAGPVAGELVTFDDALRRGYLHPSTTRSQLEMGRYRDPGFPGRKAVDKKSYLYDAAELAAWDAARRG